MSFSTDSSMSMQATAQTSVNKTLGDHAVSHAALMGEARTRNWFAVYTIPQHEKSVVKQLEVREIESFLPTYQTVRVWKNRQRMKLLLPLFPGYVFVHIDTKERTKVLQSPGVLQIVGNNRHYVSLLDSEVEFLRSAVCRQSIEPYRELVVGKKVRVRSGVMKGLQGTLVRKNKDLRFVLTIELINQHAAIQLNAEDLEPIVS